MYTYSILIATCLLIHYVVSVPFKKHLISFKSYLVEQKRTVELGKTTEQQVSYLIYVTNSLVLLHMAIFGHFQ